MSPVEIATLGRPCLAGPRFCGFSEELDGEYQPLLVIPKELPNEKVGERLQVRRGVRSIGPARHVYAETIHIPHGLFVICVVPRPVFNELTVEDFKLAPSVCGRIRDPNDVPPLKKLSQFGLEFVKCEPILQLIHELLRERAEESWSHINRPVLQTSPVHTPDAFVINRLDYLPAPGSRHLRVENPVTMKLKDLIAAILFCHFEKVPNVDQDCFQAVDSKAARIDAQHIPEALYEFGLKCFVHAACIVA